MPWKSKAQQRWGNSPAGKKALGGQSAVDEWNQATDFGDLPEVAKTKRRAKMKKALQKPSDS
jgi:hypothetical protein